MWWIWLIYTYDITSTLNSFSAIRLRLAESGPVDAEDNVINGATEGGTFRVRVVKLSGRNFGPIPYTVQPLTYLEAEDRRLFGLFPRLTDIAAARAMGM